jgi:hypothetical protein
MHDWILAHMDPGFYVRVLVHWPYLFAHMTFSILFLIHESINYVYLCIPYNYVHAQKRKRHHGGRGD